MNKIHELSPEKAKEKEPQLPPSKLREDEPGTVLKKKDMFFGAPKVFNNYFVVPRIITKNDKS
jgi:Asp-tRNA(Asn)/Glu-tRNA(Gln) amidotransferase C subunit